MISKKKRISSLVGIFLCLFFINYKFISMKKITLLALFSIAILSCQNPKEKETSQDNNKVIIGYDITEGKKTPLFSGDMMTVDIWEKYIKAHNERDIETIKGLNAENDFKVYDPMGGVIEGSEAHIAFLNDWFTNGADPKWTTKFLIANEFTSKDGKLKQWITSGHIVSFNLDGVPMKVNQVHDALIVNGKVQEFTVNERALKE